MHRTLERQRQQLIKFVLSREPTHHLVLCFNDTVGIAYSRRTLGKFFQRLDRQLLGPRYWKYECRRADMVCFIEHLETNTHWHCLGSLDPNFQGSDNRLECIVQEHWKTLSRPGKASLDVITRTPKRLASYVTKELGKPERYEAFALTSEFWSRRNEGVSVNE